MKDKMKKIPHFADAAVIYHSKEDGCWIAHSLKTDQIGTGDQVIDALADLIRGVRALLKLAMKDPTIAYLREAPQNIKDLARKSKKLPGEIFEVAYRRVTGKWPQDWNVPSPKDEADVFTAEIAGDLDKKMEGIGC